MIDEQERSSGPDGEHDESRRRAGIVAFVTGLVLTLAFFAFFPGLPHVIDWGAILAALAVGVLARWGVQAWMDRSAGKRAGPRP